MTRSARSLVDSVGRESQCRNTVADKTGERPPLFLRELWRIAEGATAPESLRQKDRFGFCDTLERVLKWAAEGVKLSGIRDRGGRQRGYAD